MANFIRWLVWATAICIFLVGSGCSFAQNRPWISLWLFVAGLAGLVLPCLANLKVFRRPDVSEPADIDVR